MKPEIQPQEPGALPVVIAISQLTAATGATEFQLRFSEEMPIVWTAVAVYPNGGAVGAGFDPESAAWRLGEQMIDGGHCLLCERGTTLVRAQDPGFTLLELCQYELAGDVVLRGCDRQPVGTRKGS